MGELRKNIDEQLKILEEMIKNNEDKDKIEKERKKLDEILNLYLKNFK